MRSRTWAKTGIAVLRNSGLQHIPTQLWETASSLETVDCTGNQLSSLPADLARLSGMRQMFLSVNILTNEGLPSFVALQRLHVLALDHNR